MWVQHIHLDWLQGQHHLPLFLITCENLLQVGCKDESATQCLRKYSIYSVWVVAYSDNALQGLTFELKVRTDCSVFVVCLLVGTSLMSMLHSLIPDYVSLQHKYFIFGNIDSQISSMAMVTQYANILITDLE